MSRDDEDLSPSLVQLIISRILNCAIAVLFLVCVWSLVPSAEESSQQRRTEKAIERSSQHAKNERAPGSSEKVEEQNPISPTSGFTMTRSAALRSQQAPATEQSEEAEFVQVAGHTATPLAQYLPASNSPVASAIDGLPEALRPLARVRAILLSVDVSLTSAAHARRPGYLPPDKAPDGDVVVSRPIPDPDLSLLGLVYERPGLLSWISIVMSPALGKGAGFDDLIAHFERSFGAGQRRSLEQDGTGRLWWWPASSAPFVGWKPSLGKRASVQLLYAPGRMTAVALDSSELPRLLDALPSSLAAPDVVEDIHERHGLFEAISSAGDWRRDSLLRQLGANSEATIERVAEAPTTYLDQKVYLEGQIHKFDGEDSFFLRRGQALVRVRGVPTEFVSRIATALRGVAHQMRYQSEVNRMTGTRSGAQLALEGVKVLSDDVEAMRYVHVLGTLTGSARVKMSLGDIVELPEITAEFVAQDVAAH